MGCGASVTRRRVSDPPGINHHFDSVHLAKEAIEKRRSKPMLENIVREIFDKDITDFYDVQSSTILGSGVSGSVRTCKCKATKRVFALKTLDKVNSLLIYIGNYHVLSHLLLIYICKLHWNLNTMFICQVNSF